MIETISKSAAQKKGETNVDGFRDKLGPFVVAAEKTRMAMVFTRNDSENSIVFVNDSFLELIGYDRGEILGQPFRALMHGVEAGDMKRIDAAFKKKTSSGIEICYQRKDATLFWSAVSINPVCDAADNVVQFATSFIDLTADKAEKAHSHMMIDELNHRVKNTLATVQSIVSQALRHNSDPVELKQAIESRLLALSRSHELLTTEHWHGAQLATVIAIAMEPFHDGGSRYVISGKSMKLTPKVTLALGIAFHELATNALKYGAFSNDVGTVDISWIVKDGRLIISWTETGGPKVVKPTRKGFGSQILARGLAFELQGTVALNFAPTGATCVIDIPEPT